MNQKIIIIGLASVVVFLSVIIISDKLVPDKPFHIQNKEDLSEITVKLTQEMTESEISLSSWDIIQMISWDPDIHLINFDPNDMGDYSRGYGKNPYKYHEITDYPNGTRTYDEFYTNGTMIKSITIHDVPEKRIIMIFKED